MAAPAGGAVVGLRPGAAASGGSCGSAATCTGTVSVSLLEPNTMREKRASQLDFRFTKSVTFGAARARVGFDIYNVMNVNDVLSITTAYGTPNGGSWMKPANILAARIFKFNARFDF